MTGSATPIDQDIRDRIVHDLDTSFAVEAGAGTGKTSLLTARIIEAARTGRARLSEIVAITFTEPAASELKVRLRDDLERLCAKATGTEAERLRQALADLDTAHVSTIHSFAAALLRERPVEASIDPGFEIAEKLTADLLFDEVWTDWLVRQLGDENSPLRPALEAGLSTERHLRGFAEFLRAHRGLRPADGAPEDANHALVCSLHDTLAEVIEAFDAAKRERALLDFDDLLRKARDLLRDNREVRRHFQQQFKLILIDECQDTDPLQIELVFFLAEDGARAADWRDVRLAPGKLLFVGDPKQSIYRFRRADIETYEEAKQVVARSGKLVHIRQNFRSAAPCVHWFNAVFAELIQRPTDGAYQPDYTPIAPFRDGPGPRVAVLRPPEGVTFNKIGEARAAEAAAIAAEIRALVERGDPIYDKGLNRTRPAQWGDVALLFRARTALNLYEEALAAADIPFRSVVGKEFFARQEVCELSSVLAAIERPFDELAVVSALRSSLLGVADDELASAAESGFQYGATAEPRTNPHVAEAFRLLSRWHEERNASSISRLVQRVLSDTKAFELFYLKPDGEQRVANLNKVIDAARAFEQTPGATFGGFVEWLRQQTTAAEEAEFPLAEEGDFVQLLTIHKAKGLEFPVVVIADMSSDGGGRSDSVRCVVHRSAGTFDAKLGGKELGIQTTGFTAADASEKLREEAEDRRLFYVAATRARDRLILPRFLKGNKPGGYAAYLADLAPELTSAFQTEIIADALPAARDKLRAFRVRFPSEPSDDECAALCRKREEWIQEREALIARAAEGRRLRAASSLEEWGHEDFGPAERENVTARLVGSAVHAVLEHLDLATGEGLAELAAEAAAHQGVPEQSQRIAALASRALAMEAVRRAAKAARTYQEVPFTVSVGGAILEGRIDLAFDDGDGLRLVDYKTDEVPAETADEHAQRYRMQLGAYALAAQEVFGKPPRSVSILFLAAGKEVAIEFTDDLAGAVRNAL